MSLLDMDERIIAVAELADIRATPITDLKEPDETGVDVGILEGGVNNSTNEEVAIRMRKRCGVLVALGDCAVFGGVPAMRNFFTIEETLRRAYIETESTDSEGFIPSDPELCVPTKVRSLQEVVPVDIFVPGCPPDADTIFYVLSELAQGRRPDIKGDKNQWQ
jgi:NAD-reducing hydrogenase small subunit